MAAPRRHGFNRPAVYGVVLLAFVGLIVLRVARDDRARTDRRALYLERCALDRAAEACGADFDARGATCQATWYGPHPPAGDQWSGFFTCVRTP
ncbi:MAG: hypothetical protein R3F60_30115 [bacterium]